MPIGRLPTEIKVESLIKKLLSQDYTIAICSTVISGDIVALLAKHHIKVISLIHELPHLIQQKLLSNENKHHLKIQQIINDKTSGSVFKQWIKVSLHQYGQTIVSPSYVCDKIKLLPYNPMVLVGTSRPLGNTKEIK